VKILLEDVPLLSNLGSLASIVGLLLAFLMLVADCSGDAEPGASIAPGNNTGVMLE